MVVYLITMQWDLGVKALDSERGAIFPWVSLIWVSGPEHELLERKSFINSGLLRSFSFISLSVLMLPS